LYKTPPYSSIGVSSEAFLSSSSIDTFIIVKVAIIRDGNPDLPLNLNRSDKTLFNKLHTNRLTFSEF